MSTTTRLLATSATLTIAVAIGSVARPALADHASAHYHKAMAYKRSGKVAQAIAELHRAIEARGDYVAAHYSVGILYRQQGNLDRAITHLERAARLEKKNGQVQYSLGLAYHQAGRRDQALAAMTRAAELNPKDPQVLFQVGVLLIRKDPERAIGFLKKAVQAQPKNADYAHQLGLAYSRATPQMTGPAEAKRRKQLLKEAEKWLRKAASMKESANIEFDLGVLYRRMEKTDKSIEHYENAIRLDPRMAPAYWDLGHMYTRAKREQDAIDAYQKYIRHGGKDRSIADKRIKELRKR